MKKNQVFWAVIILQTILILLFMIYSFTQSLEAERMRELASEQTEAAIECKDQVVELLEELDLCRKK